MMYGEMRTLHDWLRITNRTVVARELQLDPATVYRWYIGKMIPSAQNLQSLASLLGINASQIILSQPAGGNNHA